MGDGEEEISACQHGPLQRRKAKPNSWTKTRREAFLAELAYSCNVTRAHDAAGMGQRSAYVLRQRDPQFARLWQEALALGYERLEAALVRRALEVTGALAIDAAEARAEPVAAMNVDQAIKLLEQHRRSVEQGRARQYQSQARHVATQEETDAVLLKRIAMVKRQRALRGDAMVEGGV
jgi:hypothetical protein